MFPRLFGLLLFEIHHPEGGLGLTDRVGSGGQGVQALRPWLSECSYLGDSRNLEAWSLLQGQRALLEDTAISSANCDPPFSIQQNKYLKPTSQTLAIPTDFEVGLGQFLRFSRVVFIMFACASAIRPQRTNAEGFQTDLDQKSVQVCEMAKRSSSLDEVSTRGLLLNHLVAGL